MTENQAIKILEEKKSWESDDRKIDAFIMAIKALEEIQRYRKIGTVEEFANAKRSVHIADMAVEHIEKEKQEASAKAIDDAIDEVSKAICVDCGYLKGHNCTYKGSNCRVSKPMLEKVVKALEQMKEVRI